MAQIGVRRAVIGNERDRKRHTYIFNMGEAHIYSAVGQ